MLKFTQEVNAIAASNTVALVTNYFARLPKIIREENGHREIERARSEECHSNLCPGSENIIIFTQGYKQTAPHYDVKEISNQQHGFRC